MKLYRFRALDAGGLPRRGLILAASADAVDSELAARGEELLSVHPQPIRRGLRPGRSELIELCIHLEHLIEAGLPLHDALLDLERAAGRPSFRAIAAALATAVGHGVALSSAMRSLPGCFDPLLIALIAAGEASGRLPEVLRQTAAALQRIEALHAKTSRQLTYPALAGSIALGAAAFLMYYLVPQIRGFLRDSGRPLPAATQALFWLSAQLEAHGPGLLVLPPLIGSVLWLGLRHHPAWRDRFDGWMLALPILGPIRLKTCIARLGELLGLLYACGIPLLQALEICLPATGNRTLEAALQRSRQRLEAGMPLSAAFAEEPVFPPLFLRMLQVGETTGRLDSALLHLAHRYQHDASDASARLQALIEPVLTLSIGIFLGWIMLATLQPIYDIVGTLQ